MTYSTPSAHRAFRVYRQAGDKVNGFLAEEDVNSVADVLSWLQEAIARFYPHSDYAQSLEPAVKARTFPLRRLVKGALPALLWAERQPGI